MPEKIKQQNSQQLIANSNTKSKILYMDTSESEAVLAIYLWEGGTLSQKGATLLGREVWQAHRELSATLSEKYANILKSVGISQDELTGIVVFRGPGSFTGLRIGISFANSLAYGLGIPVYGTEKRESFNLDSPSESVTPLYGAEPNITKPKIR